jgi:hypothetical protein
VTEAWIVASAEGQETAMREELEQKLVERWPTWFDTNGDVRRTAMSFGFCHGDGWFDILWRLCEDLDRLSPKPLKCCKSRRSLAGYAST